jgi:hypothetical protein
VIPSDLSFGYLSAELKSPVKIPIPAVTRHAEAHCNINNRMTALDHLANGSFLKLGGKTLTTHVTPPDSSMLASEVSTITGQVHITCW